MPWPHGNPPQYQAEVVRMVGDTAIIPFFHGGGNVGQGRRREAV